MPNLEEDSRPELIFGLVGAAGARLDDLSKELTEELQTLGYKAVEIRLSGLLTKRFPAWVDQIGTGEFARITHLQNMGNACVGSRVYRAPTQAPE